MKSKINRVGDEGSEVGQRRNVVMHGQWRDQYTLSQPTGTTVNHKHNIITKSTPSKNRHVVTHTNFLAYKNVHTHGYVIHTHTHKMFIYGIVK